jgi:predicted DNA-binding transcriptional regulator AlpA
MTLPYPPPFQDLATLSAHISVGESTIENWVKLGLFPAPHKIGGKRLWQWKEVERHLACPAEAGPPSADEQADRIRVATKAAAQS